MKDTRAAKIAADAVQKQLDREATFELSKCQIAADTELGKCLLQSQQTSEVIKALTGFIKQRLILGNDGSKIKILQSNWKNRRPFISI